MRRHRARIASRPTRVVAEPLELRRLLADTQADTFPAVEGTTPVAEFLDSSDGQSVVFNSAIDTAKDVDWYVILVDQFSTVTVTVDPLGTGFDTYLNIYNTEINEQSSPLFRHYEDDDTGGGKGSQFLLTGDADQVWYVVVSSKPNKDFNINVANSGSGGPTGAYQLSINNKFNSISGKVFGDFDGNAAQNGAEPGLALRQVYSDINNNSVFDGNDLSATTETDGSYTFFGIPNDDYNIRLKKLAGDTVTTPATNLLAIRVAGGLKSVGNNFGVKSSIATAKISGTIFNDVNQNVLKETAETGLTGVTVFLDTNNNKIKDAGERTTVTDSAGAYAFSNLLAGTYRVRPILPAGFRRVANVPEFYLLTLNVGASASAKNFALTSASLVTGKVFRDINGNGKQDLDEPGLTGWKVYVDANNDRLFQGSESSVTTDAGGNFAFRFLKNAAHILRTVSPAGFAQTAPAAGGGLHVTTSNGAVINAGVFGELSIVAASLTSVSIGEKPVGSTTTIKSGRDYTVTAGGPGVTGASDGFRFLYSQLTGDFDVKVLVSSVTAAGNFSTAGIMARTNLTAGSQNVYMSASQNTFRFKSRATAGGATNVSSFSSAPFTNFWVRLQRVGNVFLGHASTDGIGWAQFGVAVITMPQTIYVGLGVASNNTTQTTTAELRNYSNADAPAP